jgi:hypothetical protein
MNIRFALMSLLLQFGTLQAAVVSEEKSWTETYPVNASMPQLHVSNIWGNVRVRTGKSGEISVAIIELRSAPNQQMFDISLQSLPLTVDSDDTGVSIVVGDPDERWQRLDRCRDCRVDYQFDIRVPPDAIIDVGTVMDGLVDVAGVTGVVSASNVNGSVAVTDIHNCGEISSVNGGVQIGFARAPLQNCSIETINGDITLRIPDSTSLDVTMDLFNGKIRSEFPVDPLSLPTTVEHITVDGQNRYRIQQRNGIRIGAGGPTYSIASMNGDVRIQKN